MRGGGEGGLPAPLGGADHALTHAQRVAVRSREDRLAALRDGAATVSTVVPGALFEARLRTLLLPEGLLESEGGAPSPLRALVAEAAAGSEAAAGAVVRRSWWVERARAVCGVSGTDAQLLFDLAVCCGADLGSALRPPSEVAQRGPFLPLADVDPSVVRPGFCERAPPLTSAVPQHTVPLTRCVAWLHGRTWSTSRSSRSRTCTAIRPRAATIGWPAVSVPAPRRTKPSRSKAMKRRATSSTAHRARTAPAGGVARGQPARRAGLGWAREARLSPPQARSSTLRCRRRAPAQGWSSCSSISQSCCTLWPPHS